MVSMVFFSQFIMVFIPSSVPLNHCQSTEKNLSHQESGANLETQAPQKYFCSHQ